MTRFLVLPLMLGTLLYAQQTVENGIAPKGKNQALALKEVFRIGDDPSDDHYIWQGSNSSLTVGPNQHLFVSDAGGSRILEYDQNGKFIRVVGDKGNGPGEYQGVPSFFVFTDGSALGLDTIPNGLPKANYYDRNLKFTEAKVTTGLDAIPVQFFNTAPNGKLIGGLLVKLDQSKGEMTLIVGVMDHNLKLVQTISESPRQLPNPAKLGEADFWVDFLSKNISQSLSGVGKVGFDGKGRMYTAQSSTYQITRWSADGKTKELVIKKKYKPIPYKDAARQSVIDNITEPLQQNAMLKQIITPAIIQKAVAKVQFPPAQSPVQGMIGTLDGGLLVIRDLGFGDGKQQYDLFDSKGVFIGSGTVPNYGLYDFSTNRTRFVFGTKKAWSLITNEDGAVELVGYQF